jgi:hypothetical protein
VSKAKPPKPAAATIRVAPSAAPSFGRFAAWAAVLVIVIAAASVRVRLLDLPLERDEGEYAYAGQLMLEGVPPYSLAYNMKFPGIYAAYAALMAVFGQTTPGIKLGVTLVNAGAIVLVFLLGRRLMNAWAGVTAAAAYAVLSASPSVLGLAGHATHFVVLAALGGLLLLLRGIERGGYLMFLWSGLCLGLSVMMKQPGAFFAVLAGLYLVWTALATRPIPWRATAARLGLLVAGSLAPFGLTCLLLWWAGVFDKFWFWTFQYATQYAGVVSGDQGWQILKANFVEQMGPAAGLWLLAGAGLVGVFAAAFIRRSGTRNRKALDAALFLAGLAVLSFVATGAGLYWRSHYFIQMLPAVALLAGATVGLTWEWAAKSKNPAMRWAVAAPLVVFLGVFGYAVNEQRAAFFTLPPAQLCRAMYGANPFPESAEIARYLREHTQPDDRIAVLGSEPQLFFDARRRSATGYIYTYGLMEPQPYAHQMQTEMIDEIEKARPKYAVVVMVPTSWLGRPNSDKTLFEWMDKYLATHYDRVGLVDILSDTQTAFYWDQAAARLPQSRYYLLVLRLREAGH